jgi:hypothetical protein
MEGKRTRGGRERGKTEGKEEEKRGAIWKERKVKMEREEEGDREKRGGGGEQVERENVENVGIA